MYEWPLFNLTLSRAKKNFFRCFIFRTRNIASKQIETFIFFAKFDVWPSSLQRLRPTSAVMADPVSSRSQSSNTSSTANDSSDNHAHNESTFDVLHGTPKRAAGASSASTPSKHAKREAHDRFIPNRSSMNFDNSLFELQRMRWRSDPFPFAIEYDLLLPLLRGARLSLSGRRKFK